MNAYFIAGGAGLSVALLILGLMRPNTEGNVRRRIFAATDPTKPRELSLAARLLLPLTKRLGGTLAAAMPSGVVTRTRERLEAAGMHVAPGQFVLAWGLVAAALPASWLVLVAAGVSLSTGGSIAMLVLCVMGMLAPRIYVAGRASERVGAIEAALPDAVDLIVTNVESGLGLQAAMLSVAERFRGPLAEEFGRTISETSIGRPRDEAIAAMAARVGTRDMQLFSRAISQAERTGIPIGKVLRSQAIEIRRRRRQLAREKAGKLPVKMTILTVAFMFPTLFLLLLGPVIVKMMDVLG